MNSLQRRLAAFVPHFIGAGTVIRFLSFVSVRIPTSIRNDHLTQNSVAWDLIGKTAMTGPYIERQGCLSAMRLGKLTCDKNSCEVIAAYNTQAALRKEEADWAERPTVSLAYPWLPVTRVRTFPEMLWEFESLGLALAGYFGTAPKRIVKYFRKRGYETELRYGRRLSEDEVLAFSRQYRAFILTAYNDRDNLMAQIHTLSITREAYGFCVHNGGMEREVYPKLFDAISAVGQGRSGPICLIGVGERGADPS